MYTATAEVFSEVHVGRLVLFSVVWSFGAVLEQQKEKKRFSRLLRKLTNILPDDDTEFLVFDYYVDESGEWDVWQSKFVSFLCRAMVASRDLAVRRVPECPCQGVDLMGNAFVETSHTVSRMKRHHLKDLWGPSR